MSVDGDPDIAVQWHLGDHMTHSYFLDTVENFRSLPKIILDLIMLILILCFIMGGLYTLRDKRYISNFHERWKHESFPRF